MVIKNWSNVKCVEVIFKGVLLRLFIVIYVYECLLCMQKMCNKSSIDRYIILIDRSESNGAKPSYKNIFSASGGRHSNYIVV